jgi:hypothetical protein
VCSFCFVVPKDAEGFTFEPRRVLSP